jgi:hypothetical protein
MNIDGYSFFEKLLHFFIQTMDEVYVIWPLIFTRAKTTRKGIKKF